jgi:hypothetical protein
VPDSARSACFGRQCGDRKGPGDPRNASARLPAGERSSTRKANRARDALQLFAHVLWQRAPGTTSVLALVFDCTRRPTRARVHALGRAAPASVRRDGGCSASPSCCSSTNRRRVSIRSRGGSCGILRSFRAGGRTIVLTTHYMDEAREALRPRRDHRSRQGDRAGHAGRADPVLGAEHFLESTSTTS